MPTDRAIPIPLPASTRRWRFKRPSRRKIVVLVCAVLASAGATAATSRYSVQVKCGPRGFWFGSMYGCLSCGDMGFRTVREIRANPHSVGVWWLGSFFFPDLVPMWAVHVPIWFITLLALPPFFVARSRLAPARCPCGYDTSTLPSAERCPECGRGIQQPPVGDMPMALHGHAETKVFQGYQTPHVLYVRPPRP